MIFTMSRIALELSLRPQRSAVQRFGTQGDTTCSSAHDYNHPLCAWTPDPKSIVTQIALLKFKSTFVLIIVEESFLIVHGHLLYLKAKDLEARNIEGFLCLKE